MRFSIVMNAMIRRSVVGSLVIVALAVTTWSAVAQAGLTPTPTAEPTASPTTTTTTTATPTPTPSEKVTVCHKGKNLISLPANAVPGHLAHGDTLGAVQCLECEFPVSGTFCACNDSWPVCLVLPLVCPLGTVLAAQSRCWACVDPLTCRPVER